MNAWADRDIERVSAMSTVARKARCLAVDSRSRRLSRYDDRRRPDAVSLYILFAEVSHRTFGARVLRMLESVAVFLVRP